MLEKVAPKFCCEKCEYSTSRKGNWIKHLTTRKHKILTNTDAFATKVAPFKCSCGRYYKHRQSLFTHVKKCTFKEDKKEEKKDKELDELAALSKTDLLNVIKEMIPKIGNTTNNNSINIHADKLMVLMVRWFTIASLLIVQS